jgi:TolA-binding protein
MHIRSVLLTAVFCLGIANVEATAQPVSPPSALPSGKIPKCRSVYGERLLQELKRKRLGLAQTLRDLRRKARKLGSRLKDDENIMKGNPELGNSPEFKADYDNTEKQFNAAEKKILEIEHEIADDEAKIKELEAMDPCQLPIPPK